MPGQMRSRHRLGPIWVDALTREDALDEVEALVKRGEGGTIFTPNLNHLVLASRSATVCAAYGRASLSFADGTPLMWASHLLGVPLPAKLSGSDMVEPIAGRAAARGWRVFLLGGAPGTAAEAAARLSAHWGVQIVGVSEAAIDLTNPAADAPILERIRCSKADLVFVALGAPKQELWMDRFAKELAPAVAMGIGGTLDFIAGRIRRAPAWISVLGLEWAYRLSREPKRLWRRYLLHDPAAIAILLRAGFTGRGDRVRLVPRTLARGPDRFDVVS